MRELTHEENRLVDYFFNLPEIKARRIAATPKNTALMEAFVEEHLHAINVAGLTWMVNQLAPKLDYLAGAELSDQLQAGADAQRLLTEAQAEKDRQARELRKRMERQALQDASGPGRHSAFSGQDEVAKQEEKERKDAQDAAAKLVRYREFQKRLSDYNVYFEPNHARRADVKKQMADAIRRDFPEFANLLTT